MIPTTNLSSMKETWFFDLTIISARVP